MDLDLLIRLLLLIGMYVSSIMALAYFIAIKMVERENKRIDKLIKECDGNN